MLRSCSVVAATKKEKNPKNQKPKNKQQQQTNKQAQLYFETHLIVPSSEPLSQQRMREVASCYSTWRTQPAQDTQQKGTSLLEGCQAAACMHGN